MAKQLTDSFRIAVFFSCGGARIKTRGETLRTVCLRFLCFYYYFSLLNTFFLSKKVLQKSIIRSSNPMS